MRRNGYTLIEAMINLLVLAIIASILIIALRFYFHVHTTAYAQEHVDWELYMIDLETYLYDVLAMSTENNGQRLVLRKSNETIMLERYDTLIRKQRSGLGHELQLVNVKKAQFTTYDNEMKIAVTFLNGIQKERTFYVIKE
ncbi:hypothetical protein GCM10007425_10560 [Lysinibacillus alkalisoli]|uniref:Competence protein ComGF n=1 Tax=Lysinibacillus alkalisoli TaxID=1911548 RepID=A0A917G245_9BACI|nr:competence type IV pilus minor pilin ComGF [Lysinibacillus alkalisoli]GGG18006.1 hypothetical protein GCM10007425_10560 [Lysinibacillus alkalisoli]